MYLASAVVVCCVIALGSAGPSRLQRSVTADFTTDATAQQITPEQAALLERLTCCAESATWTTWSACSRECGYDVIESGERQYGTQRRESRCVVSENRYHVCSTQEATCNQKLCVAPSEQWWTTWTECSAACDGGTRYPTYTGPNNQDFVLQCNTQPCEQEESECSEASVIFVLDSSASLGLLNWYKLKQTTIEVINRLPSSVKVGVVSFSTTVNRAIPLAVYDRADLIARVWALDHLAGSTSTADAIRAMTEMFNRGVSPSDVSPRVGVVISDGNSNIFAEDTPVAALDARQFPNPVTMYAIGVGHAINEEELAGIASVPADQYVLRADDFDALARIPDEISSNICQSILLGPLLPETGEPLYEALPQLISNATQTAEEAELARVQAEIFGESVSAVEAMQAAAVEAAVRKAQQIGANLTRRADNKREQATNAAQRVGRLEERLERAQEALDNARNPQQTARRQATVNEVAARLNLARIEAARLDALAEEFRRIAEEASAAVVREATLLEVSATETSTAETYIYNLVQAQAALRAELAAAAEQTAAEAAAAVEASGMDPPTEIEETSEVSVGPDCSQCIYDISRGVRYFADPLNCDRYYQCERVSAGVYRRHYMQCAPGTAWSDVMLTCVVDPTCEILNQQQQQQQEGEDGTQGCLLMPVAGDPSLYSQMVHGQLITMPCADGTVFRVSACGCTFGEAPQTSTATRDQCQLADFTFETTFHSDAPYHLTADNYGGITIVDEDEVRGRVLSLDGVDGTLKVEFFNNWFALNEISAFTVSLFVKATGSQAMGIIGNGDCTALSSVELGVHEGGELYGAVDTGDVTVAQGGQLSLDAWHHVALVYDNEFVAVYLDGNLASEAAATGAIENRHCALDIGHVMRDDGPKYFQGYMDEVRAFDCALSAEDIRELAQVAAPTAA